MRLTTLVTLIAMTILPTLISTSAYAARTVRAAKRTQQLAAPPQQIEIDGHVLPQKEAMDLLLNRGSRMTIGDFNTIRINGIDVVPYVMQPREELFLRTTTANGRFRFLIVCASDSAKPPMNVDVKDGVFLKPNQAVFAWLADDGADMQPYMTNGQSRMVYVCAPRVKEQSQLAPAGSSIDPAASSAITN